MENPLGSQIETTLLSPNLVCTVVDVIQASLSASSYSLMK